MISVEALKQFHRERSRLVRAGRWSADIERNLRRRLFGAKPRIRLGDIGRR